MERKGTNYTSISRVSAIQHGRILQATVSHHRWLLTSILWLPWRCTSEASQNSIIASSKSRQRWKSDLAQPDDPVLFPCRAESSGGCLAKLYGRPRLLWAEWCKIRHVDPILAQGGSWSSGMLVWEPCATAATAFVIPLMMVVWQRLYAAGGELPFS